MLTGSRATMAKLTVDGGYVGAGRGTSAPLKAQAAQRPCETKGCRRGMINNREWKEQESERSMKPEVDRGLETGPAG